MSTGANKSTASLAWLWALLPLLLAAALVVPLLNVDAFNDDEPASLLAAGILRPGPWSIADVWDQHRPAARAGLGHTTLHLGALRRLERVGHPCAVPLHRPANPCLGLPGRPRLLRARCRPDRCAVAQRLGLSSRLHGSRADLYAPVALCAVICVRYYWRVALHPAVQPGKVVQAGPACWAASASFIHIISAHCCCPSSASFICCSSRSSRRWWRPVLLVRDSPRWLPPCSFRFCPGGWRIQKAKTLAGTLPGGARSSFAPPEST